MYHDSKNFADSAVGVEDIRRGLLALAAGLDERFLGVGASLRKALEGIDLLIETLTSLTGALTDEEARRAVSDLHMAAEQFNAAPTVQSARQAQAKQVIGAVRTISMSMEAVAKTLRMMQIFGLNIKVAAGGEATFNTFADEMSGRLAHGEAHLDQITKDLAALTQAVGQGLKVNEALGEECARLIPHVPDQLKHNAAGLQCHIDGLVEVAESVSKVATAVRKRVAEILVAIQTADITRQRIEHVVTVLRIIEESAASDPAAAFVLRGHLLRLGEALLSDCATEFGQESNDLTKAMSLIEREAQTLLGLMSEQKSTDGGVAFLHQLQSGLAQAESMTARMRDAEQQADTIARSISATSEILTVRLKSLRDIRLSVQNVAINTSLLCRRFETIGPAIAVVANEMSLQATRLGGTMEEIEAPVAMLNASEAGEADERAGHVEDIGERLDDALTIVTQGLERTESGMRATGEDAQAVMASLVTARTTLSGEGVTRDALHNWAAQIGFNAGPDFGDVAVPAGARQILDQIARLYTMRSEREVHARFLAKCPAFAECSASPVSESLPLPVEAAPAVEQDEDGLF